MIFHADRSDKKNEKERDKAIEKILRDKIVTTDFFNFVCGDLIGQGEFRIVFEYQLDSKYVIKIDDSPYSMNILEWQIWEAVKNEPKLNKWFAPITSITRCGRVMLQRRCTSPLFKIKRGFEKKYPKQIPDFFTDYKRENWGKLGNNVVCFDYAGTKLLELRRDYKLMTPEWWNDGEGGN